VRATLVLIIKKQGRSDGGIWVYIPPKKVQVDFLRGKNDARMAIEHDRVLNFIPPQNFYTPKTNFWLRPC